MSNSKQMRWRPLDQRGVTLIELLLGMGIIALVSIAAFIIFPQVNDASRANTESQNLTAIIAGVRNLYARQANYQGLNAGIVNVARVFPRTMNDGVYTFAQPILHVGYGTVELAPVDVSMVRFAVIYRDMPTRICVKIAQNYGKNVDEVIVNGVYVKNLGDVGSNPELTIAECNRTDLVDVTFIQK